MVEKIQSKLNDSAFVRWTALILIALMMFFGYMLVDVMSPLQNLLETQRGWTPDVFGFYGSSEFMLNVFVGFLIFAGIILDKMGVRFTGVLSASLMVIGAAIKLYGVSDYFVGGGFGFEFFSSFFSSFPASAKVACIGFMIFGCGCEMAGITVSKAIAKWFKGKEMALAMGLEMAIARLGVFAVFHISPWLANMGERSVVRPLAFNVLLLVIGLLTFTVFTFMDRKLDKQLGTEEEASEEVPFKVSDLKKLFTSNVFMTVAFLCVLYYSAIFPFQRFATGMLESRLGLPTDEASGLFSWFPIGAMFLTPILGAFLDKKGKGATMLMVGSILMCGCHLIFALAPMTTLLAYAAIVLLGISFSLVPAALWPSVPKLVEERYLGSAYSVIFWIQNFGLWLLPITIGAVLNAVNPGVADNIKELQGNLDQLNKIEIRLQEIEDQTEAIAPIREKMIADLKNTPAWKISESRHALTANFMQYSEELAAIYTSKQTAEENIATEEVIEKQEAQVAQEVEEVEEAQEIQKAAADDHFALLKAEVEKMKDHVAQIDSIDDSRNMIYNYRIPMLIFASLGVLAFFLSFHLKREDHKKHYGLELPNIKE